MASYDIIGNIAIIKGDGKNKKQKLEQAKKLLKIPSVKTVLEKAGKVKGRLRTIKPKYIAGEKNFIVNYKENACRFKFDIRTCYFSPRLSNDRKQVALKIKKKDNVLVMFSGVGVYPIVISKYKKPARIVSIELGRDCNKYAIENARLNQMQDNIEFIQGDVKKKIKKGGLIVKGNLVPLQFDFIMMARPNLKDSFLEQALIASKKGTRIFYHLFCRDKDLKEEVEKLVSEAKELGRKIQVKKKVFAGEIAPYKHRYRIEIKVLN
jgi:tRNA (guanine37-N1)-methyltransferase